MPALVNIRPARATEHQLLSQIARESKAYWGYSADALAHWKDDLSVSPASIEDRPTLVAEMAGDVAGFYQLCRSGAGAELNHFWVKPDYMGQGLGRALLKHAAQNALDRWDQNLNIDSDPHAEGFYLACGAARTGVVPAPIAGEPNRVRPQLVMRINAT